jgi:hypothetical protein
MEYISYSVLFCVGSGFLTLYFFYYVQSLDVCDKPISRRSGVFCEEWQTNIQDVIQQDLSIAKYQLYEVQFSLRIQDAHWFKKFAVFYGIRISSVVLTKIRHYSLYSAKTIQSTPHSSYYFRIHSNIILPYSHTCQFLHLLSDNSNTKHEDPINAISSNFLLFNPSYIQLFTSAPCSQISSAYNLTLMWESRSQWPRCLRYEQLSLFQTLVSWVRIPLKARMSVCIYSVFVLCCVYVAASRRVDSPSKESCRLCIGLRNWKSGQGPTKGLQSHRQIDNVREQVQYGVKTNLKDH